jgi:hypothetical protein
MAVGTAKGALKQMNGELGLATVHVPVERGQPAIYASREIYESQRYANEFAGSASHLASGWKLLRPTAFLEVYSGKHCAT